MRKLYRGAVGTGAGTLLYTAPKELRCDLKDIIISNTTSAPIRFKMHVVDAGGSPSNSNLLIPNVSIPGNTFIHWEGIEILQPEDFIQGIGSSSGITISIAGDEHR